MLTQQDKMRPIVRRALAKHGKAGEKVFIVTGHGGGEWVAVSKTGRVRESPAAKYRAAAQPSRKK